MTSDNVPGKPAGRGMRIALMASLALNVLIIGGVMGSMLVARYHWKAHSGKAFGLLAFAETLPADRAEVVRKTVEEREATLAPLRQAEREARASARSALTAEPFDAAKFSEALARAADADAAEKRARLQILADTAAVLTQEERRKLHDWFEARRRRFRHHHKDEVVKDEPSIPKSEVAPASAQ